jgi:hypothetical protein
MGRITTTATLASCCPACGRKIDAATGILNGASPAPGDLSVCWSCGEIMRFCQDLTLEAAGPDEVQALDVTARRALLLAQRGIRRRGVLPPEGGGH